MFLKLSKRLLIGLLFIPFLSCGQEFVTASVGDDGGHGGHGDDSLCAVAREGCTPGDRRNSNDNDREDIPSVRESYKELEDRFGGGYADLRFASRSNIQDYRLGNMAPNTPIEEGRVFVELENVSNNSYYEGSVVVSYEYDHPRDGMMLKHHEFRTDGRDARYNLWTRFDDGKFGFHGFFQNDFEAIILVVDNLYDASGESDSRVFRCNPSRTDCPNADNAVGTGSVWFKAFKNEGRGRCHDNGRYINLKTFPNAPDKRCWDISVGPFDCRAWKTSTKVDTFRALEPRSSCYKKLADFNFPNKSKRLPIGEAFGADHIVIHSSKL